MAQQIGPKELAMRELREARAAEAKSKPRVEALKQAVAAIPVKRRPKMKKGKM